MEGYFKFLVLEKGIGVKIHYLVFLSDYLFNLIETADKYVNLQKEKDITIENISNFYGDNYLF